MSFTNYTYLNKVPFKIHADYESLIYTIQSCSSAVVQPSSFSFSSVRQPVSTTFSKTMHVPSCFCYTIVDHEYTVVKPPLAYRKINVVYKFLVELTKQPSFLIKIIRSVTPVNMTDTYDDKNLPDIATALERYVLCEFRQTTFYRHLRVF